MADPEDADEITQEKIKKAFQKIALKNHPDKQQDCEDAAANEKMKIVNAAYAILKDPEKRKAYDDDYRRKAQAQAEVERREESQEAQHAPNPYPNPNRERWQRKPRDDHQKRKRPEEEELGAKKKIIKKREDEEREKMMIKKREEELRTLQDFRKTSRRRVDEMRKLVNGISESRLLRLWRPSDQEINVGPREIQNAIERHGEAVGEVLMRKTEAFISMSRAADAQSIGRRLSLIQIGSSVFRLELCKKLK